MNQKDFITRYMEFVNLEQSEAPANYHRWSCIGMLGALLGRNVCLPFGHSRIYPNQYIMLMGSPGTRKGTAMSICRKLAKASGFTRFAADKTSKERFLMDMKQHELGDATIEDIEELVFDEPSEAWICNGEFTDFIGQGNMEFITLLTNLWDNLAEYKHPKIHGKPVEVHQPTVNILAANTPQGFSLAFPPEAIGNGFLSRVIFVHGEPTGKQIAWPEPADELVEADLADHLKKMRKEVKGEITISKEARKLGDAIYKGYVPMEDSRFAHYATRRFIHLLKIAMILAAVDMRDVLIEKDLLRANSVLVAAERKMPKALGEFGKNRNSDVANSIIDYLSRSTVPRSAPEIYKVIATDLNKQSDLAEILGGLQRAEKIKTMRMGTKVGFVTHHVQQNQWKEELLDNDWLTLEEQA